LSGWLEHYQRGIGSSLRHNQTAYAYSVTITAIFGILSKERGAADVPSCFLFVAGAGAAFLVVNAGVTKGFRERLPREPSEVIALGTAFSFLSMGAALGIAGIVGRLLGDRAAWPTAAFASTIVYLSIAGLEMAFAGYAHEAGGVGGEFDT
jgi:hypothetical protein